MAVNENLNKNYELLGKNYENLFLEIAGRELGEVARNTSANIISKDKLILDFFEIKVMVDMSEKKIFNFFSRSENGTLTPLDLFTSTIILHFLVTANGIQLTGEWISYRDLPGGLFYASTIPGVLQSLVKRYESSGIKFIEKLVKSGGEVNKSFEFAATVYPFKKFPILFILDEKDEEFEARMRVLFDSSARHYLKTDVIKILLTYMMGKFLSPDS
ncbi:DUF3786 domain-containing protein [Candidatus Pacearchaeota archaeon]|nr:DUF3786 domain-containing protein [Candidatus Pacearchaeota archaeon]